MHQSLLIIPAYNEEQNIIKTIDSVLMQNLSIDILVIDDGSQDNTAKLVIEKGISIVLLPFNLGYGGAIQTGYKYAVLNNYRSVIQFDADGQHDAKDIGTILNLLNDGKYDIVIGSRFVEGKNKHKSILKRIAVSLFNKIIYLSTKQNLSDPTSGLKGLNYPVFSYFSKMYNLPMDYPDADVLINVLKCGFKIIEFPATMHDRRLGISMHSGIRPIYYFIKVCFSILIISIRWMILKREDILNG
jgi:glycosyltransferase involved in cell wall biosynthesis